MKILVLNGPNINMQGIREPQIYGNRTYSDLVRTIKNYCDEKDITVEFFNPTTKARSSTKFRTLTFQRRTAS